MSRYSFEDIKSSRFFCRDRFRHTVGWLMVSLFIMVLLTLGIVYQLFIRGEPDYYATNSAGFITPLNALDAPNRSNEALLAPDPTEEMQSREVRL